MVCREIIICAQFYKEKSVRQMKLTRLAIIRVAWPRQSSSSYGAVAQTTKYLSVIILFYCRLYFYQNSSSQFLQSWAIIWINGYNASNMHYIITKTYILHIFITKNACTNLIGTFHVWYNCSTIYKTFWSGSLCLTVGQLYT